MSDKTETWLTRGLEGALALLMAVTMGACGYLVHQTEKQNTRQDVILAEHTKLLSMLERRISLREAGGLSPAQIKEFYELMTKLTMETSSQQRQIDNIIERHERKIDALITSVRMLSDSMEGRQ